MLGESWELAYSFAPIAFPMVSILRNLELKSEDVKQTKLALK